MHPSALARIKKFKKDFNITNKDVCELGSQIVPSQEHFSIRKVFDDCKSYTGLDMSPYNGVDIVLEDPYNFTLPDNSFDVVLASSVFEHSEFFWLTFLEMCRVCKPSGYVYLNMPSTGPVHRHPVDCWRFYPDAGQALSKWANRNNINTKLVEHDLNTKNSPQWKDYTCIIQKLG